MEAGKVGMRGHAPALLIKPVINPERTKYQRMWEHDIYRQISPGEQIAHIFLAQAKPRRGDHVIDFGCGTGRGAMMLAILGGLKVTMVDFATNALDTEVANALLTQSHMLSFKSEDLEREISVKARYGYCCDVMEHIPTHRVDRVLKNVLAAAQHVFFQISLVEDNCGAVINEKLHVTIQPYEWWKTAIREAGGFISWSTYGDTAALFYVTAWRDADELVKRGRVNSAPETITRNVLSAISRKQLPQLMPYVAQETEVAICGGGPSIDGFVDDIRKLHEAGGKIVTVGGSYHWALKHKLQVGAQVVVDSRPFNARFVRPHDPKTKYMIASQCDPSVFDAAPPDRTLMFHAALSDDICDMLDKNFHEAGKPWYPVPGGSTVMLRAIPLMMILGFRHFHLYGFDSCLGEGNRHHAYAQPENDREGVISVTCGDRVFRCHPWMVSQAHEFMGLVRMLGDEVKLAVHGDGLISHILQTGAVLADEDSVP